MQIPSISGGSNIDDHAAAATASLAMTSFGIRLTVVCQQDLLLDF